MFNLTTLDRLAQRWKDKPISFGEFGYSCGYKMQDGTYLDPQCAAIGEILYYLYSHIKGYSGAMIWMLSERPIANKQHNEPWAIADPQRYYQSHFGMYYYNGNGTLQGKPKPIVYLSHFFSKYILNSNDKGTLNIVRADTRIKTGYEYKGKNIRMVGNVKYDGDCFSFESTEPVNVMFAKDKDYIHLLSTGNVEINLKINKNKSMRIFLMAGNEISISHKNQNSKLKGAREYEIKKI